MTSPSGGYRVVAGLRVPLPLVPRIIAAMRARYPEATDPIADDEAAIRAAIRAWVVETLAEYEAAVARAPLGVTVAQTVASFETKAAAAKAKALTDSTSIVEDESAPSTPAP